MALKYIRINLCSENNIKRTWQGWYIEVICRCRIQNFSLKFATPNRIYRTESKEKDINFNIEIFIRMKRMDKIFCTMNKYYINVRDNKDLANVRQWFQ